MLFLQLLALALCCPVLPTAATLLLAEDFSCASIGCNATSHGITNYTYWRHSTTGSKRSSLTIGPAGSGRAGNAVNFSVTYCAPPTPNPKHLGCYRSELALQHRIQVLGPIGAVVDVDIPIKHPHIPRVTPVVRLVDAAGHTAFSGRSVALLVH